MQIRYCVLEWQQHCKKEREGGRLRGQWKDVLVCQAPILCQTAEEVITEYIGWQGGTSSPFWTSNQTLYDKVILFISSVQFYSCVVGKFGANSKLMLLEVKYPIDKFNFTWKQVHGGFVSNTIWYWYHSSVDAISTENRSVFCTTNHSTQYTSISLHIFLS